MKKSYINPLIKVYTIKPAAILAGSPNRLSEDVVYNESMVGAKRRSVYWDDEEDEE